MNTTLTHSSITVLGAGSFGTALAIAFSRNGHLTHLWGHNPIKMQKLDSERQNTVIFTGDCFSRFVTNRNGFSQSHSSFT